MDIQKSWSFVSVVQYPTTAPTLLPELSRLCRAAEARAQVLQTSPHHAPVFRGCCLQLGVDFASTEVAERKLTVEEEEAKRIAEMGKPILGEHPKLEVIIEESYEFKVSSCSRCPPGGEGCVTMRAAMESRTEAGGGCLCRERAAGR